MKKQDIVKRSLLLGVGLAAFAREHSEKVVYGLVKKGLVDPKEGKKLVKNIYSEAEKSGKKVAKVMEKELNRVVKTALGAQKNVMKSASGAKKRVVRASVGKKKVVKRKKK